MDNPADSIVWVNRKGELIARLGVMDVGVIGQVRDGRSHYCAHWRCFLPGVGVSPRPALDEAQAKTQLVEAILRWIDAAQLAPAVVTAAPIRAFRQAAQS